MNTRARMATRTAAWLSPRLWLTLLVLSLGLGLVAVRPAHAQEAVQLASADELDVLVGPIALYPDDLVAIVLPASTYPLQVVQAARLLEDRKRDSSLTADDDWDDSIVALLNYPEVVQMMNDDLDWTYDLGTAVLNQRADVLNAVQNFRDRAYAAGNLRTDDRQTVARDDGELTIKPANPQVIYVPYYEPERVVIYQTVPVYHYYPRRYPVYYYPYPASYVFDTGYFWGVRSWFSIGWHSHLVHVYDWGYHSHPYYGWSYYDPWYTRNVYVNINVNRNRDYVWEPRNRYGGRPVVRGNEGRVYTSNEPPRTRTGGGMAGGAYRSRTVESTAEARATAEAARQPRRGVVSDGATRARTEANVARNPSTGVAPRSQANTSRESTAQQDSNAAVRERIYRSGGGMSQAQRQPQSRATQESTGMPREALRSAEPQRSYERAAQPSYERTPPQSQESRGGGGMGQAQRGGGDGGGRSAGDSGGGREHAAARGGEGRGAAR